MAKVKSIDVSTDAGLPSGWTGTTRSTVATVQDHEGLVKECLAEETRVYKGRRVENLLLSAASGGNSLNSSNDLTGATKSNVTISYSGANDETTLTDDNGAGFCRWVKSVNTHDITSGRDYIATAEIKGTGSSIGKVAGIEGTAGSGTDTATITLTGSYQRVALSFNTSTGVYLYTYFLLGYGSGTVGSGESIIVKNLQIEDVTGQTNQNPSEYVSVGVYRENLFPSSYEFDNSDWNTLNAVVTADQIDAPDDLGSACLVDVDTTSGAHELYPDTVSLTSSSAYTFSIYAKANELSFIQITESTGFDSATYQNYNLSTGALGNSGGTVEGASISDEGGGWYRCIFTATASGSTGNFRIALLEADTDSRRPSYAGTTGEGVYLFGAQFELGSSATDYIHTTGAAGKEYSHGQGVNGPDGVQYFATTNPWTVSGNVATEGSSTALTGMSILLEPNRENLLLRSEEFNTTWGKSGCSVTSDNTAAPNGETIADKVYKSSSAGNGGLWQALTLPSAGTYYLSVFAKKDVNDWICLRTNGYDTDYSMFFDLTNGETGSALSGTTVAIDKGIESLANDWYRCWIEVSTTTDLAGYVYIYIADADDDIFVNVNDSVFLWGGQKEKDNLTSYIKTEGTAVTRNADPAPYAPLTTPQSAGTVVVEFDPDIGQTSSAAQTIVGFDNITSDGVIIRAANDDITIDDGTNTASDTLTGDASAFAARWKTGEIQIGFRTGADTWAWGTATAAYDGGFPTDNLVYLMHSIQDVANVSVLDVYDDNKTTSWIESNYPPSQGGGGSMPPIMRHRINLMSN